MQSYEAPIFGNEMNSMGKLIEIEYLQRYLYVGNQQFYEQPQYEMMQQAIPQQHPTNMPQANATNYQMMMEGQSVPPAAAASNQFQAQMPRIDGNNNPAAGFGQVRPGGGGGGGAVPSHDNYSNYYGFDRNSYYALNGFTPMNQINYDQEKMSQ